MANIVIYNPSAVVPNQVTQYLLSVHTPDYKDNPNALINPSINSVQGLPQKYWKVSGNAVLAMTSGEQSTIDAFLLPGVKTASKNALKYTADNVVGQGYPLETRNNLLSMFSDSIKSRPLRANYLQAYMNWVSVIDTEVQTKMVAVDAAISEAEVNAISIDTALIIAADPHVTVAGALAILDSTDLDNFLNANSVVVDPYTNISGPYYLMEILNHRRDLYNDTENPVYLPEHPHILGSNGMLQDHANRILNVEEIHGKLGWHNLEVTKALYKKPKNLLIYYSYLNSFNSAYNGWNNEKVAQEMSRYDILILADGVQYPTHPDYANSVVIIARIKELNPNALIFGYVALAQPYGDFLEKVDLWNGVDLEVHGIFLDEAGYDYGKTRAEFNTCISYIHNLTNAKLCFANAWNTDHVLGTANDLSYPNSTYNPTLAPSLLTSDDWILLESFTVNTDAYTGDAGYASKSDWYVRGQKVVSLRATYGVNFAASGVINNSNVNGAALFDFMYLSSLMYSLEAVGSSDTTYASSSAAVTFWPRVDVSDIGSLHALYPSVVVSTADADVYMRYVESAVLSLDFSSGAHLSSINKYEKTSNISCLAKITGIDGKAVAETTLYTVPIGKSAVIVSAVVRPTVATSVTVVPTIGIGINATSDNVFISTSLIGLNAVTKLYRFQAEGTYTLAASGESIKLGVDTEATATTLTLSVDLFGYLI